MDKNNTKQDNKVSAIKAGTWYVISSVFVKAAAIITTPVFTRLMTRPQYGITATFISWYSLLLPVCTVNLAFSIGRAKLDFPEQLDNYIGSMQLLSALVTVTFTALCLVSLEPLAALLKLDSVVIILLMIYLLFTPAITFAQNGYRYRYQYRQNIAIAWYTGVGTILLSLLLMLSVDADRAFLRIIGIVLPNVLLSIFIWVKGIYRGNIHINIGYWKYGLHLSVPLVLHTVCLNILSQSDRVFIQAIQGETATAVYSLAYSYGLALSVVTSAVADGWLPWFHDNYFNKNFEIIRKNTQKVVVLGCYVGLACIALAPEAIRLLGGKGYEEGVSCVLPIVLGVVCQYIYTHYVNIELHLKKTRYVSMGTIIAALVNIALNAVFIPRYGFVAAAYTTLASYLVLMIIHYMITRRVLHVKLYNDFFMFAAMLVTFVVAFIVTQTYPFLLIRYGLLLIGFLSFVVVYRQYIFIFVRKFCRRIIDKP